MAGLSVTVPGVPRLPDFIVIGAMKAGSTTLWGLLASHPAIFVCEPKEPQFFSRDERYARGLGEYAKLFAGARADQIAGESSTCYSRWPHHGDVAARIARDLPGVKLVYLLRHPVERAYSHYGHLMEERAIKRTGPIISFARALDEVPEIIDASNYALQLERFLAHFRRDALHVLALEDLHARPDATWAALVGFLGAPAIGVPAPRLEAENRAGTRVARGSMRRALARIRGASGLSGLIDLVPQRARVRGRAWMEGPRVARWLMRRRVAAHRERISPLDLEDRARLVARLDEPTRALEKLLARDLSSWRR